MIPLITYTNSKCNDIHHIYLDLISTYYGNCDHTIISNEYSKNFSNLQFVKYNIDDPFYKIWLSLLSKYKNEYFIYMQDDFFLYKPVNVSLLTYYLKIMIENPEMSFIRLLKSGIKSTNYTNTNTLFELNNNLDYTFSMQATLWKTFDFYKLMDTKIMNIPWDEPKLSSNIFNALNISGYYHYDNEPKRGLNHYDSNIFPYVATALVKGKWNIREYPELSSILSKYNVIINNRGTYQ